MGWSVRVASMPYHFSNERRTADRRVAKQPHAGPERRLAERRATEVKLVRKPQPIHRGVLWAAVLMVLVLSDSVWLDGAYRHMVTGGIAGWVASVRYWSDHVWDRRA